LIIPAALVHEHHHSILSLLSIVPISISSPSFRVICRGARMESLQAAGQCAILGRLMEHEASKSTWNHFT
jgi:hypothetical protein